MLSAAMNMDDVGGGTLDAVAGEGVDLHAAGRLREDGVYVTRGGGRQLDALRRQGAGHEDALRGQRKLCGGTLCGASGGDDSRRDARKVFVGVVLIGGNGRIGTQWHHNLLIVPANAR